MTWADLPTSLRLALPYPKKKGFIVGMRGKKGEEEAREVDWDVLGLQLIEMKKLILPFMEETRVLLLFQRPDTQPRIAADRRSEYQSSSEITSFQRDEFVLSNR